MDHEWYVRSGCDNCTSNDLFAPDFGRPPLLTVLCPRAVPFGGGSLRKVQGGHGPALKIRTVKEGTGQTTGHAYACKTRCGARPLHAHSRGQDQGCARTHGIKTMESRRPRGHAPKVGIPNCLNNCRIKPSVRSARQAAHMPRELSGSTSTSVQSTVGDVSQCP